MSDFLVLSAVLGVAAYLVYRAGTLFAVYGWLLLAFFGFVVFFLRLWLCSCPRRSRKSRKYSTKN